MRWFISIVTTLLVATPAFGAGGPDVQAQREMDREAQRIAAGLMSPFCPGKTLTTCPSPRAAGWRTEIREWVGQGVPEEAIEARLQARVPSFRLSAFLPGAWNWAVPALAVLAVTGVIVGVYRRGGRSRRGSESEPAPAPSAPSELKSELDRELAALD